MRVINGLFIVSIGEDDWVAAEGCFQIPLKDSLALCNPDHKRCRTGAAAAAPLEVARVGMGTIWKKWRKLKWSDEAAPLQPEIALSIP